MTAVGETTGQGERLDVRERFLDPFFHTPKLQFTHPRRVDHERTRWRLHEFAPGGRVTPFAVFLPHLASRQRVRITGERVDETGFSDAG